jgi:hypothetical protein
MFDIHAYLMPKSIFMDAFLFCEKQQDCLDRSSESKESKESGISHVARGCSQRASQAQSTPPTQNRMNAG